MSNGVKKTKVDGGMRRGVFTYMAARMKSLEHAGSEMRQANELLWKASAYFAMAPLEV